MGNRFFSLIVIPDSGNEVKSENFSSKFVITLFSSLIIIFFTCMFFIVGYHIKLYQEKDYKQTISVNRKLCERIKQTENLLATISEKLAMIKRNDIAFRLIENMDILDDEMYNAGIGGHLIVDDSDFDIFNNDLKASLNIISYDIATLEPRINVQQNSLLEIEGKCKINLEMIDNTPSILPTPFIRVTSSYGWRIHPISGNRDYHTGIDLGGSRGQSIYATADGVVTSAGRKGQLGFCVVIKHKYGYETLYGHLNKLKVTVGQEVKKRDVVGEMGRTGNATGVHLHYAVSLNGRSQNPIQYLK